ncbi:MAG: epoxyqueuosine reductase QueH [Dehalococcoidia bacterium]|nr:epoxyqueuosine reductase QueH [Dehalococcoidia bacterium]
MPKILIHACCAHCTAYTMEHFRQEGIEVTALWYNPNIHPYLEHENRLAAMKALAEKMAFPLIVVPGYDLTRYLRAVSGHESTRCQDCFRLRLQRTAKIAIDMEIGAFSTSLLISPHQEHELARMVGEEIAANTGATFRYVDLRKRYSDSRRITKPLELYRQQYCGCLFSEYERYANTKIQTPSADEPLSLNGES